MLQPQRVKALEVRLLSPLLNLAMFIIHTRMEVQGLSFVGSTSEICRPHPLRNLQNLGPVPPYSTLYGYFHSIISPWLSEIAKLCFFFFFSFSISFSSGVSDKTSRAGSSATQLPPPYFLIPLFFAYYYNELRLGYSI